MNSRQLIDETIRRSGVCRQTVEYLLPICFDIIRETVVTGENDGRVCINGFGTFYSSNTGTRTVISPLLPGQILKVPKKVRPRFSPTSGFFNDLESRIHNPTSMPFQQPLGFTERARNYIDPRTEDPKKQQTLERRHTRQRQALSDARARQKELMQINNEM